MEVYNNVQPHMNISTDEHLWECDEDDLFYAELRKQVLSLTAEDDDVFQESQKNKLQTSEKALHQRCKTIHLTSKLQHECYYNWSGNEATETVPSWLFHLWKSGNGTGVFIPQIAKSGARYKPRRKKNNTGRMYKPVADVRS